MNLSSCEIISKVEFGSTFQGTSDEQSDRDYMSLVIQPLEETVFRKTEKATKHINNDRYYAVERFVSLVMKGSFDNVLLLTAQLKQAKPTSFNQLVLSDFYDDYIFNIYMWAHIEKYTFSLIGRLNKLKDCCKNGKEMVKHETFKFHLERLITFLEGKYAYSCKDFAQVELPQDVLDNKRVEKEFYPTDIEPLINRAKTLLKEKQNRICYMRTVWGYHEDKIKTYLIDYLIERRG